jgi:pimeloyl-ACP methyl ester carboxylesterase
LDDVRTSFAATDDGEQLYIRDVGRGPAIICCNGVGVSTFFWSYVVEYFRDRYQVVLWDYRGHGRSTLPSSPETADLSMERFAKDLRVVVEALQLDAPVILIGHSMGCQVLLQYAVDHPTDVRAMVPMLGTFARPLDTLLDSPYSKRIFDVAHKAALGAGRGGRRWFRPLVGAPWALDLARRTGLVDRHYASRGDLEMYLDHLNQMDPRAFWRTVALMAEHDLTERLPELQIPALVIAAENDLFTPLHRSQTMAELLPQAELFVIAEGSHAALVEHPQTINRRIDRFLAERVAP